VCDLTWVHVEVLLSVLMSSCRSHSTLLDKHYSDAVHLSYLSVLRRRRGTCDCLTCRYSGVACLVVLPVMCHSITRFTCLITGVVVIWWRWLSPVFVCVCVCVCVRVCACVCSCVCVCVSSDLEEYTYARDSRLMNHIHDGWLLVSLTISLLSLLWLPCVADAVVSSYGRPM